MVKYVSWIFWILFGVQCVWFEFESNSNSNNNSNIFSNQFQNLIANWAFSLKPKSVGCPPSFLALAIEPP
jgi:hypothetical protein